MNMTERVARAIAKTIPGETWEAWKDAAEAAIEEMETYVPPASEVTQEVAAIRGDVMEGFATVKDFAAGIKKCERAVWGYLTAGMPVEYIGRTPYVVVKPAIEWLRANGRRRRNTEPRRVGRPAQPANPP